MKKKLNRSTVPESSVRIPKIGEWSIGASEPVEPPPKVVSPLRMRVGMSPTKVSKRFTQALPQVPVEEPPFAIRPPKMNASDFIPSDRNLIFPPGTVTTDVTDILKSRFRAPRRPLPPLRGREEVEVEPQYLPLEMFDDATYQEYPLEELLQEPYAFSRYQDLDGTSYWAKCTVVEYDEKNEIFTIEWDGTRKRKQVARFNLRFEKEDPDLYEKRIAEAKKSCARYETMLRFEARVAEMPTAALPQLSKTNLDNFRTRMGLDVSKQYLVLLKGMENEVKKDFVTMNNRLDFLWDLTDRDRRLLCLEFVWVRNSSRQIACPGSSSSRTICLGRWSMSWNRVSLRTNSLRELEMVEFPRWSSRDVRRQKIPLS